MYNVTNKCGPFEHFIQRILKTIDNNKKYVLSTTSAY